MVGQIFAAFFLVCLALNSRFVWAKSAGVKADQSTRYCKPEQSCWPSAADWKRLGSRLTGRLEMPSSILQPCRTDALSAACLAAIDNLKNPFFIESQTGGTQSTGWLGAWDAAVSAYAVASENSNDIVEAVNFARKHKLKLVIKATGHDYLGRSNAADSLLVWTHKMREVTSTKAFVPQGCPLSTPGMPAVMIDAGARWLEAYREVTINSGRYVQGGGCTSVGAAGGFLQGGGFGSWSRKYGIAAASMLQAEVVTADGRILIANSCQNQDLFWALRGGGGGTFGVVTKVVLMTHELPKYFGLVSGSITAKTDAAFQDLLEQFILFYGERLNNEHWGEQVRIQADNSLHLSLAFQGMSAKEAEKVWAPFAAWVEQRKDTLTMKAAYFDFPGNKMWDYDYLNKNLPGSVVADRTSAAPGDGFWWWADDSGQVSAYWYAYQSRWIPEKYFTKAESKSFASLLFQASRQWPLGLHFNKGQAGASAEARRRGKETSMNPAVFDAAALLIVAAQGQGFPGISGKEPDYAAGKIAKAKVDAAMKIIGAATLHAGTYPNEADYFEENWQDSFWGIHYKKLLAIKRKYDPSGLFSCHHCVGSEEIP